MRIDSGLSSYSFQSRYVPVTSEKDDAAPETTNAAKARTGSPSTFSSTLISNNLASALWSVDGGRRMVETQPSSSLRSDRPDDASVAEKIEAAYREYELSDEDHA